MFYAANHQYTRAFGSLPLVQAIADYHKKRFPNLDPENEIVTTNGGVEALYNAINALMDEGDEAVFFDPSYDCYRAQVQMSGGKSVGIPLKPRVRVPLPIFSKLRICSSSEAKAESIRPQRTTNGISTSKLLKKV